MLHNESLVVINCNEYQDPDSYLTPPYLAIKDLVAQLVTGVVKVCGQFPPKSRKISGLVRLFLSAWYIGLSIYGLKGAGTLLIFIAQLVKSYEYF